MKHLGDILLVLGFVSVGVGVWFIDWRYSLMVMGMLAMLGGAMALRGGQNGNIQSYISKEGYWDYKP